MRRSQSIDSACVRTSSHHIPFFISDQISISTDVSSDVPFMLSAFKTHNKYILQHDPYNCTFDPFNLFALFRFVPSV